MSEPLSTAPIEVWRAERDKRRAAAALAIVRRDADAIRGRCQKFSSFVKEAWHILEPTNPLKWSWHLDALCDHLEAISRGTLFPRVIFNVPPGSSKSMICSVFWQAWEWGPLGKPSIRFLTTSFELDNVTRDTRKTRDLIRSDWFQALWNLPLVRAGETSFANAETGTREGAAFVSVMGKRGDRVVVDDPHSLKGAESEAERTTTTRLFLEGGLNRLNDQMASAIVIVMQRVHETDLTGMLLAHSLGFIHVMIPMEFEVSRRCETPLPWRDPRRWDGELMDPVRMPPAAIAPLKKVSSYAWAGQYQQRPAPREGGMFKRRWFGEPVGAAPVSYQTVRAWDLAATEADGDWTVGVRMCRADNGLFYIEHVERFRGSAFEVESAIKNLAVQDGRRVTVRLPQDPGQAGKGQVAAFARLLAGWDLDIERESGSKEVRATPFAAQCEAGNVKLVAGDWNLAFLDELENFPMGAHDDQVDAVAGAFNTLVKFPTMNVSADAVAAAKRPPAGYANHRMRRR